MKKATLYLLASHIIAALMWLSALIITNHACPGGTCSATGFKYILLFFPAVIISAVLVIFDITQLIKHFVPLRYKSLVGWLAPTIIIGSVTLGFATEALVTFGQRNYSAKKAINLIKTCQALELGGYGSHPYIYLKKDPYNSILVSGGDSARNALSEAAQSSAASCGYDLNKFILPAN